MHPLNPLVNLFKIGSVIDLFACGNAIAKAQFSALDF